MADAITNLKAIINPVIMEFSIEEWHEIKEHLEDRHSTIQGGSVIIDAMGGNSELKELESRFQCELFEAIFSYANHLNKANDISKRIDETKKSIESNKDIISRLF